MKYCPYCRKTVDVKSNINMKYIILILLFYLLTVALWLELMKIVRLFSLNMITIFSIFSVIIWIVIPVIIIKLPLNIHVQKCSMCRNDLSKNADVFCDEKEIERCECFSEGTERLVGEYRHYQIDEYNSIEMQIDELRKKE